MKYYWREVSEMCSISSMPEVYLQILQILLPFIHEVPLAKMLGAKHMRDKNVGNILKRL